MAFERWNQLVEDAINGKLNTTRQQSSSHECEGEENKDEIIEKRVRGENN